MTSDVFIRTDYQSAHIGASIVFGHGRATVRFMETIGGRLKKLRDSHELTQIQFCERAGIKQSAYSLVESGKSDDMKASNLAKICHTYGVTAEYIMLGTPSVSGGLHPEEKEAVQLLRNTSEDNRQTAMRSLRAIAVPAGKRRIA